MTKSILLIDDDDSLRRVTEHNLTTAGFTVIPAADGTEGRELFNKNKPDLVITDVMLGDADGLELLQLFKLHNPDIPVIIITAFGSIDMAVKAMSQGAFTFITKPFDRDTLRLSCQKALELATLKRKTRNLTKELNRLTGSEDMKTVNPAMAELLSTAHKVAGSEATVLITGESGTGKEVLARYIHAHSPRRDEIFMGVNCAAIPESLMESELFGHVKGAFTGAVKDRKGKFQTAHQGSLFLDEIGELQPEMQVKLLRILQEKMVEPVGGDRSELVDVRIIAATNRNLQNDIESGRFREDLFYRLSVIPLHLPPLRERSEDIPGLIIHFMKKFAAPADISFSAEAIAKLQAYQWPGNIRELQNIVERSLILRSAKIITGDDILLPDPRGCRGDENTLRIPPQGISLEEVERKLILQAMEMSGNNRSQAARLLRIPRHVLIYRLEKYNTKQ